MTIIVRCPHCGLENPPTSADATTGQHLVLDPHRRADWIAGTDSDVEMCMGAGLLVGEQCQHQLAVSQRHCWSVVGDSGRTTQARPVPRTIQATS